MLRGAQHRRRRRRKGVGLAGAGVPGQRSGGSLPVPQRRVCPPAGCSSHQQCDDPTLLANSAASQWTSDTQQCLEVLHFVSECGLAETAGRTARHLARPCCVLFSHVLDGARGDAEALRLKVEASMREGAPKLVASIGEGGGGRPRGVRAPASEPPPAVPASPPAHHLSATKQTAWHAALLHLPRDEPLPLASLPLLPQTSTLVERWAKRCPTAPTCTRRCPRTKTTCSSRSPATKNCRWDETTPLLRRPCTPAARLPCQPAAAARLPCQPAAAARRRLT